jgi:hypothetical protein
MASIPSKRKPWKWEVKTPTISQGTMQIVTRETMPARLNNEELVIIQMDVNPYLVGSVILLKGKPIVAYCPNLANKTCCTTTRNELCSIIMKLSAQPDILPRYKVEVCTKNRHLRCEHVDAEHVNKTLCCFLIRDLDYEVD